MTTESWSTSEDGGQDRRPGGAGRTALPGVMAGASAFVVGGTEPVVTGVPLTPFTDSSSDTSKTIVESLTR